MIDDATVRKELEKEDDHIWLSALSIWLRRNLPESVVDEQGDAAESLPGMVANRLHKLASARQFYHERYREFDKLARTLPEPYRTQAFDILANGKIAPWNETKQPTMTWIPATQNPPAYQVVLLAFAPTGRMHDYTTGWWADRANGGKGVWVGLALNQSPPTYPLEDGAVCFWATIEVPGGEVQP